MLIKFKKFIFFIFFIFTFNLYAFETNSVYNLNIEFTNNFNKNIFFSDLNGKVCILAMIYTHCKTVCPIIISNMKSIEKLFTQDELNNINFVLITLDPDRDNIEVLNKFYFDKNLNKNWFLLKTTKINTLKLSHILGIKYKKESTGDYVHSNLILLIDKFGVIKTYHQGLDKDYSNLIHTIKNLM